MTMKLFISGWAGFREVLRDIPEDWYFINPFQPLNEEEILDFLKSQSGEKVIGWSTGGHIILKNIHYFSERFNEILVVAGFRKFTQYVSPRIIRKMIEKMKIEPEIVIKDFLINAGCKPIIPENLDYKKLIEGLNFLISSELTDFSYKQSNLILIHGIDDKVLPIKALNDLKVMYPFAKTIEVKGPHWINFEEILNIRASDNN